MTSEFDIKHRQTLASTGGYAWLIVVLAALAMLATLPGRTHGLGMITERLLNDQSLELDRQLFGYVNLWATLIGALFCLPCGWMIDRLGLRLSLSVIVGLLGVVVLAMTRAHGVIQFAFLITLTRGFGQSALSVISIALIGKWFRSRLPLAMGVYSVLVSVLFTAAFLWGKSQSALDWRSQWDQLGLVLLFVMTPLFAVLVRSAPEALPDGTGAVQQSASNDFTFTEALSTPAFWMFGFATSLYGLISSGLSLFNESLLVERGFAKTAYYDLSMMTMAIGLGANLLTGWICSQIRITWVAAAAMSILSAALLGLQFVSTPAALITYAVAMGCAGGMVTVLFFAVFARLFGRAHLGRIQGIAQMLTVFASALGPVVMAEVKTRMGSYLPAVNFLGILAAVFAVAVAIVPIPRRQDLTAETISGASPNLTNAIPATLKGET